MDEGNLSQGQRPLLQSRCDLPLVKMQHVKRSGGQAGGGRRRNEGPKSAPSDAQAWASSLPQQEEEAGLTARQAKVTSVHTQRKSRRRRGQDGFPGGRGRRAKVVGSPRQRKGRVLHERLQTESRFCHLVLPSKTGSDSLTYRTGR